MISPALWYSGAQVFKLDTSWRLTTSSSYLIMAIPTQPELFQLLQLINTSTTTVANAYRDADVPYPSVYDAFTPFSAAVHNFPHVQQATQVLVAACKQLIASVTMPAAYVAETGLMVHIVTPKIRRGIINAPVVAPQLHGDSSCHWGARLRGSSQCWRWRDACQWHR